MTDAYRFDESSTEQAIAYAKIYAGENYSPAMETVLKVAFSEKRNLPTFRLKSSDTILLSGYMKKWVGAYLAGYNNRPSVRTDAVDFCKADGSLLQIKTSDNSENSSSSRVRQGTPIGKWFRRFSRRPGVYNWESLNRMLGRPGYVSESDFRAFAEKTIAANPACIYIAANHLLNRP